jgi:hypothetical protein
MAIEYIGMRKSEDGFTVDNKGYLVDTIHYLIKSDHCDDRKLDVIKNQFIPRLGDLHPDEMSLKATSISVDVEYNGNETKLYNIAVEFTEYAGYDDDILSIDELGYLFDLQVTPVKTEVPFNKAYATNVPGSSLDYSSQDLYNKELKNEPLNVSWNNVFNKGLSDGLIPPPGNNQATALNHDQPTVPVTNSLGEPINDKTIDYTTNFSFYYYVKASGNERLISTLFETYLNSTNTNDDGIFLSSIGKFTGKITDIKYDYVVKRIQNKHKGIVTYNDIALYKISLVIEHKITGWGQRLANMSFNFMYEGFVSRIYRDGGAGEFGEPVFGGSSERPPTTNPGDDPDDTDPREGIPRIGFGNSKQILTQMEWALDHNKFKPKDYKNAVSNVTPVDDIMPISPHNNKISLATNPASAASTVSSIVYYLDYLDLKPTSWEPLGFIAAPIKYIRAIRNKNNDE